MNASLHVDDADFALDQGFSVNFDKSEVYQRTGHPCREDFETFGRQIGLNNVQISKAIAPFIGSGEQVRSMTERSFLDDRSKRMYLRFYEERISRFIRKQ